MGSATAPAGAAATTTTTTAPPATTTTTTATAPTTTTTTTTFPAGATKADKWVIRAITAEQKFGSVHVVGKITQGKSQIVLELLVNADGEGGGEFVQDGNLIKIERVGPLLYFNAPTKFWTTHATAAQTKVYGGKWIEFSAVDPRFTSFDQFLDAADLVVAAFQGHTAPLTVSQPTTFAGHKVVIVKDTVTNKGKREHGPHVHRRQGPGPRVQDRRRHPGRREHGRLQPLRQGRHADGPAQCHQPVLIRGRVAESTCRTDSGGRTAATPNYLTSPPRTPPAAPAAMSWLRSSRSGMYSPITPARIGSGIDCSQMRPGPVSTAKW